MKILAPIYKSSMQIIQQRRGDTFRGRNRFERVHLRNCHLLLIKTVSIHKSPARTYCTSYSQKKREIAIFKTVSARKANTDSTIYEKGILKSLRQN